jgi:uncharacterized protein YbjT (DUF2867 family)
VAYAARDDMASAIAGRLESGWTQSAVLELTGHQAFGNSEVAGLVTDVTGQPIEIVSLSD